MVTLALCIKKNPDPQSYTTKTEMPVALSEMPLSGLLRLHDIRSSPLSPISVAS